MHHFALLTLLLPSLITALLLKRQTSTSAYDPQSTHAIFAYLEQVCFPVNGTGYPNFDTPCQAVSAIDFECNFGSAGLPYYIAGSQLASGNNASIIGGDNAAIIIPPSLDYATQQQCTCESQFFDQLIGCATCYVKHGAPAQVRNFLPDPSAVAGISSSYCAVTATPTIDLPYAVFPTDLIDTTSSASTSSMLPNFSDPIGNKTDVSLYYTPLVTGTAAWQVPQATLTGTYPTEPFGSASAGGASSSRSTSTSASSSVSVKTSNGQIVETLALPTSTAASIANAASSASGASTPSSGNAAQRTEVAAVAGAIAFAGLLAVL